MTAALILLALALIALPVENALLVRRHNRLTGEHRPWWWLP